MFRFSFVTDNDRVFFLYFALSSYGRMCNCIWRANWVYKHRHVTLIQMDYDIVVFFFTHSNEFLEDVTISSIY